MIQNLPPTKRARLACRRFRPFFDFDNPDHRLYFAVVERAVIDAATGSRHHACDARQYLQKNLSHAALCGLDPDWMRDTLGKLGIVVSRNQVDADRPRSEPMTQHKIQTFADGREP